MLLSPCSELRLLLEHTPRIIGLPICLHDRLHLSGLPLHFQRHLHPACPQARKGKRTQRCVEYDGDKVHRALQKKPSGRIHTCPYGLTEIALPVFACRELAGVLFAGPCWTQESPCPYPGLKIPPNSSWLDERKILLRAVAERIGTLLEQNEALLDNQASRRLQILNFICDTLKRPIGLDDLAEELNLSPSRTGHVINDLFHDSLPNLVNARKLEEAAFQLLVTDLSIGEIARWVGIADPNYLSRLFRKKYGCSPTAYRRRHREFPPHATAPTV